ncbi:MAG: hypothetical protein Q7J15_02775 [Candidatus Desulfaltia sp.]|nr:hypothetical protein [Candidatus Desulfaltia sp.]
MSENGVVFEAIQQLMTPPVKPLGLKEMINSGGATMRYELHFQIN